MRHFLILCALLMSGGAAQAYKLTCNWVFSERVEDFLHSNSAERLTGAIERYKQIMKITDFTHKPVTMDAVKTRLPRLRPWEKAELRKMVLDHYNEVKAMKYNNDGPFKTFKRHLDLVVSQEINAPRFFRDQIYNKKRSLEQALDEYYKRMQELTGAPVVLEGADVLLTALRMQERFSSEKDNMIVFYGSFVNGKVYSKSSDLDFAVIDPKLEVEMREENLLAMLKEFPLSEAQAHTVRPKQAHGLGYMNPLVMVVRKD